MLLRARSPGGRVGRVPLLEFNRTPTERQRNFLTKKYFDGRPQSEMHFSLGLLFFNIFSKKFKTAEAPPKSGHSARNSKSCETSLGPMNSRESPLQVENRGNPPHLARPAGRRPAEKSPRAPCPPTAAPAGGALRLFPAGVAQPAGQGEARGKRGQGRILRCVGPAFGRQPEVAAPSISGGPGVFTASKTMPAPGEDVSNRS